MSRKGQKKWAVRRLEFKTGSKSSYYKYALTFGGKIQHVFNTREEARRALLDIQNYSKAVSYRKSRVQTHRILGTNVYIVNDKDYR